ncbi:hypothetical protein PAEPH01_1312 [Pancytospora epiphaga]|nr:hypothetical protein PAEPH01_1312 [Pancytospora epiphaga]
MRREVKVQKTLDDFLKILINIKSYKEGRRRSLNRMFWEYNNLNVNEFEDNETRYRRIVHEKRPYPGAFFASSLGFTKSTMQVKYGDLLRRYKLDRRPAVASLKNSLHYEKLKHLIIKYFELLKK